jgi:hypothetical protein
METIGEEGEVIGTPDTNGDLEGPRCGAKGGRMKTDERKVKGERKEKRMEKKDV